MTYYLRDICCLCLSVSNELFKDLLSKYPDNSTHLKKIAATFPELSTVIETDSRICSKCSGTIDFIYNFNKTCLKNITLLSSYKEILKENLAKKHCVLYVDLSKSKQFKENITSLIDIKLEPVDSFLNSDVKRNTIFMLENDPNEIKVKEEIVGNVICNEIFLPDSEIKEEIVENDLKKEWLNEIEIGQDYESLTPNTKDLGNILKPTSTEVVYIKKEESREEIEEKHLLEVAGKKLHESQDCGDSSSQIQFFIQEKPDKSKKKNFSCNECGKKFRDNTALNDHLRVHSGERPFKCNICEKSYIQKSTLNHHMIIHTGEKPYKCDMCNKKFNNKSYLGRHKLIHSGNKPYHCDQCDKHFFQNSNLVAHKRIHSGEKPYKCDVCRKAFAVKSSLYKHNRVHTGNKPFSCSMCPTSFGNRAQLTIHILSTHNY